MRVVILICEGVHEVELVQRLTKPGEHTAWAPYDLPLQNYPTPLSRFLTQKLTVRANVELRTLGQLAQPDPPRLVYAFQSSDYPDCVVLMHQMGGEQQREQLVEYLSELRTTLLGTAQGFGSFGQTTGGPRVKAWALGLLFDADGAGDDKLVRWSELLSELTGGTCLSHGHWLRSERFGGEIGGFLLRGDGASTGTLESMLKGALTPHYATILPKVTAFLQEHKPERSKLYRGQDKPKEVIARAARELKASFVVMGQYDRTEQGLPPVIRHSDLFDDASLAAEPSIQALLNFIGLGCKT